MTTTVRTTISPEKDIEVGDAELVDLRRMGLIVSPAADESTSEEPKPEQRTTRGGAKTVDGGVPAVGTTEKGA